jgi:hypothetical protein
VAACRPKINDPHWSRNGRTVVARAFVTCVGTLARVRVRVTTFLARVNRHGGLSLVASGIEDRTVVVGEKPIPVYCPRRTAKQGQVSGTYRAVATFLEPQPATTPLLLGDEGSPSRKYFGLLGTFPAGSCVKSYDKS